MGSDIEVVWRSAAEPVVALEGVEPVFDVGKWFGSDVVDVVAGVGVAFHEAGSAQDAEVLADEWLAASEGVGESGGRAGLVRERPEDPLARPVGEEVERGQGAWITGWTRLVSYSRRYARRKPGRVPGSGGIGWE